MAEPADLNSSIGMGTMNVGDISSAATKFGIWVLEILMEAVGTCLVLIFFAFFQFRHEEPPLGNDLSFYKVLGISVFVLIEFAATGYLATTLISRFVLRGKIQRLYPYVCAALYLIHSTIFFIAAGNPLLRRDDWIIQICGALLALACTWGGNQLIAYWGASDRT